MKGDIVSIQNAEELPEKLRAETDGRIRPRLIFLNAMANHGISYEKASDICGLSMSTGYVWIRKWNAEGYDGLTDKKGTVYFSSDEVGGWIHSPKSF